MRNQWCGWGRGAGAFCGLLEASEWQHPMFLEKFLRASRCARQPWFARLSPKLSGRSQALAHEAHAARPMPCMALRAEEQWGLSGPWSWTLRPEVENNEVASLLPAHSLWPSRRFLSLTPPRLSFQPRDSPLLRGGVESEPLSTLGSRTGGTGHISRWTATEAGRAEGQIMAEDRAGVLVPMGRAEPVLRKARLPGRFCPVLQLCTNP